MEKNSKDRQQGRTSQFEELPKREKGTVRGGFFLIPTPQEKWRRWNM